MQKEQGEEEKIQKDVREKRREVEKIEVFKLRKELEIELLRKNEEEREKREESQTVAEGKEGEVGQETVAEQDLSEEQESVSQEETIAEQDVTEKNKNEEQESGNLDEVFVLRDPALLTRHQRRKASYRL